MFEGLRDGKLILGGVASVIGGLLLVGDTSVQDGQPALEASRSISCEAIVMNRLGRSDAFTAHLYWSQRPGAHAEYIRYLYYDGHSTHEYPLEAAESTPSRLQLSTSYHSLIHARVTAYIIDSAGRYASCPGRNVIVK